MTRRTMTISYDDASDRASAMYICSVVAANDSLRFESDGPDSQASRRVFDEILRQMDWMQSHCIDWDDRDHIDEFESRDANGEMLVEIPREDGQWYFNVDRIVRAAFGGDASQGQDDTEEE